MNPPGNSQTDSTAFPLGAPGLDAATSPVVATSSVASLDSAILQQTKSEIRTLAAEIARLAEADIPLDDFFSGFMPRVCTAMGATGLCAWEVSATGNLQLLASHTAPAALFAGPAVGKSAPAPKHRRVLDCVIAEGQPILVPPGDVKIETDRPANPLSEALIVVPIRIEARVDYLLEVIQRPSGGPTAQRGYLRFVAQMADLMSDFLRRSRLREIDHKRQELENLQNQLCNVASAKTPADRLQSAALAVSELVGGDQAMVVSVEGRPRVVGTSHHQNFDPRSEPVLACQSFVAHALASRDLLDRWLPATDRRQTIAAETTHVAANAGELPANRQPGGETKSDDETSHSHNRNLSELQLAIDTLCDQLGCRSVRCSVLNSKNRLVVVILSDHIDRAADGKVLAAIGGLLSDTQARSARTRWLRQLTGISAASSRKHALGIWITRTVAATLAVVVACFPVPQTVSATATLHPTSKQLYYAPSAGTVAEVLVDDGEVVAAGQPLLRVVNPDLQSQLDQLESQLQLAGQRLEEKTNQLNAGGQLDDIEIDQLESEIEQLLITQDSSEKQIEILTAQRDRLAIHATQPGQISAWDVRNNLLHRPVKPGDLLLSTFHASSQWTLRIAVPERRIGQIIDAPTPLQATFSLSSHPDQSFDAMVLRVGSKAIRDEATQSGVVVVEASVDGNTLPLKKDGAVARTEIQCGKVPLVWLVFRDAAIAIKSRALMLW